jgi:uncharacterized coiled-coil protein SlyX
MDNNPSSERLSKLEAKLESHAEQMKALSYDLRDGRGNIDKFAQCFRESIDGLKKEMTSQLVTLTEKVNSLETANAAYKAERAIVVFLLGGLFAGGAITIGISFNQPLHTEQKPTSVQGSTP